MRFGRGTLIVFVGAALAAYAVDCYGMTTPAEAMKCCQSMPCSPSGHSQECCEAMLQMHAPFVKPPFARGLSFAPHVIAVLGVSQESLSNDSDSYHIARFLLVSPGAGPPTAIPIRI